jgi:septal ring factor EnvC (AmiA/AmiB activator)
MKKSSFLMVLAAVALSLFLTGCESAEEKQARLQEIESLQNRIQAGEKYIEVNKNIIANQKGVIAQQEINGLNVEWAKNELIESEKNLKKSEETLEKNKAKLKELQK